jgi:hypothetical protein
MFSTSYLFHVNFVPFFLRSLYDKYKHLCIISSPDLTNMEKMLIFGLGKGVGGSRLSAKFLK